MVVGVSGSEEGIMVEFGALACLASTPAPLGLRGALACAAHVALNVRHVGLTWRSGMRGSRGAHTCNGTVVAGQMHRDGCSWWRKRLGHMEQYFHAYRIDHVLGFFRMWEIPKNGGSGQYVPSGGLREQVLPSPFQHPPQYPPHYLPKYPRRKVEPSPLTVH